MTSFATTSDGSLAACLWVAVRVLVLVGWLLGGTAALAVVAHDRGYISASVMEYVLVGAFGGFIAHAIGIASAGARCVRRRGRHGHPWWYRYGRRSRAGTPTEVVHR